MKLRSPLFRPQFLFAAGCAFLLASAATAPAQAVRFSIGRGTPQEGTFVGTDASGVKLKVGGQVIALPPSAFGTFEMVAPPEYAAGYTAFSTRDYPAALTKIKSVTDRFKGLPTAWAQYATTLLGDIYLATDDLDKAEAAYNDAKRLYSTAGTPSAVSEVGPALIAVRKKDYATAKAKVEPIIAEALSEKSPPPAKAMAYSKAFLVSGEVKEAEGNLPGALEDYLRTVTIFHHDPAAVSIAQEQADKLRADAKEQPITVP